MATDESSAFDADEAARQGLQRLLADQTELICCWRPDGTVTDVNAAFCAYFGQERERIVGSLFMPTIPRTDVTVLKLKVANLTPKQPVISVDCRIKKNDTGMHWLRGTLRAWFDAHGSPVEYQVTALDITEQKGAEEALVLARDHLEQRVSQRTVELEEANTKLLRAVHEAERARNAMSDFLANISHEIRTPMNGILGIADLLSDTTLSAEQRRQIDTLRRSARLLLNLINDILDFSRIEAGMLTLHCVQFDPRTIVEDIVALLAPTAEEKGIEVIQRIPPNLPTRMTGDPARLRQILLNLVGNAIKFTDTGYVFINLQFTIPDPGTCAVTLTIEDTGIGIPADKQAHIFDKFTQAHGYEQGERGGTGLGLAISARLVEIMQGTIEVESREGHGSIFRVELAFPCSEAGLFPVPLGPPAPRILIGSALSLQRQIWLEQFQSVDAIVEAAATPDETAALIRRAAEDGRPFQAAVLSHDTSGFNIADLFHQIEDLAPADQPRYMLLCTARDHHALGTLENPRIAGQIIRPIGFRLLIEGVRMMLAQREDNTGPRINRQYILQTLSFENEKQREPNATLPAQPRILLVEDNEINQMVATDMLKHMNCEVAHARDGQDAIEHLQTQPFDAIVMDCRMPHMDGYEATRRIRALPGDIARIPIIAMTASTTEQVKQKCLDAGMDDFLTKPIQRDDLHRTLTHWLGQTTQVEATPDKLRILIVEDDEQAQSALIRIIRLSFPGAQVQTAEHGIHACALLGSFLPSLVLMDIMMPDLDGTSVIEFMRNNPRYARIPVVVITALAHDDPRVERARLHGVEAVVHKPYRIDPLVEILDRCLLNTRAALPSESDQFSLVGIKRRTGMPERTCRRLVQILLRDSDATLAELNRALACGDSAALREISHKLKGGSSVLKLTEITEPAAIIETAAEANRLGEVAPLITRIETGFGQLAASFPEVVETLRTEAADAAEPETGESAEPPALFAGADQFIRDILKAYARRNVLQTVEMAHRAAEEATLRNAPALAKLAGAIVHAGESMNLPALEKALNRLHQDTGISDEDD